MAFATTGAGVISYHAPIRTAVIPGAAPIPQRRSLVAQVARKMVFWACLNTLLLTAVGYFFVSERAEQRTLAYLQGYLTERIRAETQPFKTGEANLKLFADRFLRLYNDPAVLKSSTFQDHFEAKADGTFRLRRTLFDGSVDATGVKRDGASGFIGRKRPALTEEFKRRLMISYRMVTEFGPAWRSQFENLYVTTPENGVVMHWPGIPWGLEVHPDEYFPDDKVVGPTMQWRNPLRRPVWTSLYWDNIAKSWSVTYALPVDAAGRHLISAHHDIVLDDLVARLVQNSPVGAHNVILGKGGELIAHPFRMDHLKGWRPTVETFGDERLKAVYRSVHRDWRNNPKQPVRIVESEELDAYLCYGEIAGPGWFFVTVYPRSLVLQAGRELANALLVVGLLSLALMTLVVVGVLRKRVSRPIGQMKLASEHVALGDFAAVAEGRVSLPEEQDNEMGLLALSFRAMAKKVGDNNRNLELAVSERTVELKTANDALERLSFRDGLTGALNRRAFDRDFADALHRPAAAQPSLMLCDVDHFKLFNDTYGHVAGDGALRAVADALTGCSNGRLYRYGGEELALLIDGPFPVEAALDLVRRVAGLAIPHEKSAFGILTISAGLLRIDRRSHAAAIIEAADMLLYRAKDGGRNRLVYDDLPPKPIAA